MQLDLLKMVIPFRCAQFLKGLGIEQESMFYWVVDGDKVKLHAHPDLNLLIEGYEAITFRVNEKTFSAFTTDELLKVFTEHKITHPALEKLGMTFRYRRYKSPFFDLSENIRPATALIDFIEAVEKHEQEKLRKHKAPKENDSPENSPIHK